MPQTMTDVCEADAEHNVSITPSTPTPQQSIAAMRVGHIEGHGTRCDSTSRAMHMEDGTANATSSTSPGVDTPVKPNRIADTHPEGGGGRDMPLTPWHQCTATPLISYDGVDLLAALRSRDEELLECKLALQSYRPRCLELEARCQAAEEEAMRWHLTLMQERERQRAAAATLAQEAIRLEADLAPLRREREALQESVEQLQRDVAAQQAAQDAQQETLHSLQSKLTASEWAKRQAEAEVRRLRGEIERWTRTCQETAREQVRLESANLKLQAQLSETQRRLQSALVQPVAGVTASTTMAISSSVGSQEKQTVAPPRLSPSRDLPSDEGPPQAAMRCVDNSGVEQDVDRDNTIRRLRAELESQFHAAEEARRRYAQTCEAAVAVAQETAARRSATQTDEAWANDVAAVMATLLQRGQTLLPRSEAIAECLQDEKTKDRDCDRSSEYGKRDAVIQKLGWVLEVVLTELGHAINARDEAAQATVQLWQHRCRTAQEELVVLQSRLEKAMRAEHSRLCDQTQRTEVLDEVLHKMSVLVCNALREHGKRRVTNGVGASRLPAALNTSRCANDDGNPADRPRTTSTTELAKPVEVSALDSLMLPSSSSPGSTRGVAATDTTRESVQVDTRDERVAVARSTYTALLALLDAVRELKIEHRTLQQKHKQHIAQSASSLLLAQKRLAEAEEQLTRQTRRGELAVQRTRETQTQCTRELQERCAAAEARATALARETGRAADDLAAARRRAEAAEGDARDLRRELAQRDKALEEMRAANTRLEADRAHAEAELGEWRDGMQRAMQAAESHAACSTQAVRRADVLHDGLTQCVRFMLCCLVQHRQLLGAQRALQAAALTDRRELSVLHSFIRALRVSQDGLLQPQTDAAQHAGADADGLTRQVEGDEKRVDATRRRWRAALHVVVAVYYIQRRLQCHRRLLCETQRDDTPPAGATQTLLDLLSYPLANFYGRRLQRQILPRVRLPPAPDLAAALGTARDGTAGDAGVLRALLASINVVMQSDATVYCGVSLLTSCLAPPLPTAPAASMSSSSTYQGDPLARGGAVVQLRRIVREVRRGQTGLRDKLCQISHDLDVATAQNTRLTELLRREEAGRRAIKEDIASLEAEMHSRPGQAELEGLRTSLQEALRAVGNERTERRALEERLARQQHREGDLLAAQVRLKNEIRSLHMELAQARYTLQPSINRPLQIAAEDAFEPMLLRPTRPTRPPVESLMMSVEEGDCQASTTAARLPTPLQSTQHPPLAATGTATAGTTPVSSAAITTQYTDHRQYRYYDALLRHACHSGEVPVEKSGACGATTRQDELPLSEPTLLRTPRHHTHSRPHSPHGTAPHTPRPARSADASSDVTTPPPTAAVMRGCENGTMSLRPSHGDGVELVADLIEVETKGDVRLSLLCCQCRRRFAFDRTRVCCSSSNPTLSATTTNPPMRTQSAATAGPLTAPVEPLPDEAEMHQSDRDAAMVELMAGCNGFGAYFERLIAPCAETEMALSSSSGASSSRRVGGAECMSDEGVRRTDGGYDSLCASRTTAAGPYAALRPSSLSPWLTRTTSTAATNARPVSTTSASLPSRQSSTTAMDVTVKDKLDVLPSDAALQVWQARMRCIMQQACHHSHPNLVSSRTTCGAAELRTWLPPCLVQHLDWIDEVAARRLLRRSPFYYSATCQSSPCSPVTSPHDASIVATIAESDSDVSAVTEKRYVVAGTTVRATAFTPYDLCLAGGAGHGARQGIFFGARCEAALYILMRHLVRHGAGDDVRLPLCLSCWHSRQLAPAQRAAVERLEDMALCSASAVPTVLNLACCYTPPHLAGQSHKKNHDVPFSTSISSSYSDADTESEAWRDETKSEVDGCGTVDGQEAMARVPWRRRLDEVNAQLARVVRQLGELRAVRGALERQVRENESQLCIGAQRAQSRRVTARYEELDETANRACFAAALRRSLRFLRCMPLLSLLYPIDVSGPIGLIDGLRLGLEVCPSSSPSQNIENIPTMLHVAADSASDEVAHLAEDVLRQRLSTQRLLSSTTPMSKVQLTEVNTACGAVLRLLVCLAHLHGYRYRCAVLHPCDESSTIDILHAKERNTAATGRVLVSRTVDFYITDRFFAWRTFGTACVVVATCLRELCELLTEELQLTVARGGVTVDTACESHVQMSELPASPPYTIRHDIVGGVSVRHGSVDNAIWTMAMRCLLADLQWAVCASAKLAWLRGEVG